MMTMVTWVFKRRTMLFFKNIIGQIYFKKLYDYVSACTIYQTRSAQKVKPPIQGTGIPPCPFAKLSPDLSGPYPKCLSGNRYITAFVDWYSGWPEAFAVPDKTAETIAYLIINEIFPRFGCPLELVTDNGSENCNKVVKETLEVLNIHHVCTSFIVLNQIAAWNASIILCMTS